MEIDQKKDTLANLGVGLTKDSKGLSLTDDKNPCSN